MIYLSILLISHPQSIYLSNYSLNQPEIGKLAKKNINNFCKLIIAVYLSRKLFYFFLFVLSILNRNPQRANLNNRISMKIAQIHDSTSLLANKTQSFGFHIHFLDYFIILKISDGLFFCNCNCNFVTIVNALFHALQSHLKG